MFHNSYLSCRQFLQVSDAFLECSVLLSRSDGLLDIGDDPVNHVLLFHSSQHVGSFKLVVKTLLNLLMGLNQSCSVCSLKMEANSFLLGLDNVSPGSGAGLLLQFCVNGILAGVNLILSDGFQF